MLLKSQPGAWSTGPHFWWNQSWGHSSGRIEWRPLPSFCRQGSWGPLLRQVVTASVHNSADTGLSFSPQTCRLDSPPAPPLHWSGLWASSGSSDLENKMIVLMLYGRPVGQHWLQVVLWPLTGVYNMMFFLFPIAEYAWRAVLFVFVVTHPRPSVRFLVEENLMGKHTALENVAYNSECH